MGGVNERLRTHLKREKEHLTWLKQEALKTRKALVYLEKALAEQLVMLPQMEKEIKAFKEEKVKV